MAYQTTVDHNHTIFRRAKEFMRCRVAEMKDTDIQNLRHIFLKDSWEKDAKYFLNTRSKAGLTIDNLASMTKIRRKDLVKLEQAEDFQYRDMVAEFLLQYLEQREN